jgi:DNA-binding NarL/FixJ family response regulator
MSTHVRVVVVSDDALFREGLHRILTGITDLQVIDSPDAADVALVDSARDDALALCSVLTAAVILVAAPLDETWARDALCAGAAGILTHQTSPDELCRAIREVAAGSIWAPRRVLAASLRHLARGERRGLHGQASLEARLSAREREVLRHAATGLGNKELAVRLAIGEATVKAHLTRIFRKLGARGRGELAAMYVGIAPLREPSSSGPQPHDITRAGKNPLVANRT